MSLVMVAIKPPEMQASVTLLRQSENRRCTSCHVYHEPTRYVHPR